MVQIAVGRPARVRFCLYVSRNRTCILCVGIGISRDVVGARNGLLQDRQKTKKEWKRDSHVFALICLCATKNDRIA